MVNKYRFSPIDSKENLIRAVRYVASETSAMAEKIIGKNLPISSLTIFSHYPEEFEFLSKLALALGILYNENNGPRVTLSEPIIVNANTITHLRIRKPDKERPQVGCNDFDVPDYSTFKEQYLPLYPDNLKLIKRPEYEMIEFSHPDYDALSYVVSIKM
jgi:hypothetical protein